MHRLHLYEPPIDEDEDDDDCDLPTLESQALLPLPQLMRFGSLTLLALGSVILLAATFSALTRE